ncbi:RES domain-containing protein [Rhodoferax lacus]|uniref:RES domain-containing protein n=1 Tax=Rhodoferax lacus TaxID=2184758 RepID=A0A3E1R6A0_9BURK|nr:RES family NAD+ phosphorylase [Rhodoferax lacus]RFO94898.1 RES domain-containing protein [Rhodoferax lacus]
MSERGVWDPAWFEGGMAPKSMLAWRGVEAQHVVSTMRLVDSRAEQEALELLLEHSKPPQPAMHAPKHYLLYTPFRYRPPHPSRFRRAGERGLWYGAEQLYTACAEVAYWRNRFILDSAALVKTELLTEHTFFQAEVQGLALDLMQVPWVEARSAWTHGSDYSATQALAEAARYKGVQWICYESVRAPGQRCAAVLDVDALAMVDGGKTMQTWHCKASKDAVMMVCGADTQVWKF